MELNEAYLKVRLTPEEEASIKRYLNYEHASMNILANLRIELYNDLKKNWVIFSKPEEVKKMIQDFVNIYSVMYKNSANYFGNTLTRGTTNAEIRNLEEEYNRIVSTSRDEMIAKRFMKAQDGALIHFNLENGVPFLDAEEYREEHRENEKEIILAPFCRVAKKENLYGIDSYIHYRVTMKKPELESVPQEVLEQLMEETTQGFEDNIEKITRYKALIDRIEWLDRIYDRSERGDQREIAKDKKEAYRQMHEMKQQTSDFKKKLQTLLKGLCKQKELEIDKAREVIEEDRIRREKARAEQARKVQIAEMASKIAENPKDVETLNYRILATYQKLQENENRCKEKAESLGVSYTKTMGNTKIAERMKIIQETLESIQETAENVELTENDSQETVDGIVVRILPLVDGVRFGIVQAEDFPKLVDLHVKQSENEIKKNLYGKVQKTLQQAKIQQYTQEKEKIAKEKIGFFGRFTGKKVWQEERKNQIDLKLELAKQTVPEEKESYQEQDMLVDMVVCAKTELEGNFTSEMTDLYTKIKAFCHSNHVSLQEEEIGSMAEQKINQQKNKLPSVKPHQLGFFGKRKAQVDLLRQENMNLKSQIMEEKQKRKESFYKVADEQDAIVAFDAKLRSIDTITRQNLQIEKDGTTLELW